MALYSLTSRTSSTPCWLAFWPKVRRYVEGVLYQLICSAKGLYRAIFALVLFPSLVRNIIIDHEIPRSEISSYGLPSGKWHLSLAGLAVLSNYVPLCTSQADHVDPRTSPCDLGLQRVPVSPTVAPISTESFRRGNRNLLTSRHFQQ